MYRKFPVRRLVAMLALIAIPVSQAAATPALGEQQFPVSAVGSGNSGLSNNRFRARTPAIAIDQESRRALVVWSADDATFRAGEDGRQCAADTEALCLADDEYEIFGSLRDAGSGATVRTPFRISVMGDDEEEDPEERKRFGARKPAVAWNPVVQEFLVVWEGDDHIAPLVENEYEIFAQRINLDGELLGDRFRVSVMGNDSETDPAERARYGAFEPAIAVNPVTGDYLVVWRGDDDTAPLVDDEYEIFGQRISAEGELQDSRFRISTMGDDAETGSAERRKYGAHAPAITFNPVSGNFVVAWHGDDNRNGLVNNENEIFVQQVDVTGALAGGRVRVSHMGPDGNPDFDALSPSLAVDPATGTLLIAWHGDTRLGLLDEGEVEVFGRRLDADLNFLDPMFRISVMGTDSEGDPAERRKFRGESAAVAWSPWTSEFLVAWHGDTQQGRMVQGEFEVFGRFVKRDGSMPAGKFRISFQGDDDEKDAEERIKHQSETATVGQAAGGFFVAWSGGLNGQRQIRARRAASVYTDLRLAWGRESNFVKAPNPVVYFLEVSNYGEETAENVRISVTQTEAFPVSFSNCLAVRDENICELGDLEPEEKVEVELSLATDHIRFGDPQRTTLTIAALSDTALDNAGTARISTEATVSYTEKGGSGAIGWMWLLFAGVPLLVRRRVGK